MTTGARNSSHRQPGFSGGLVIALLVAGVFLLFGVSPSLLESYVLHAPGGPDAAVGAVYEFNQHGTMVYLTLRQLVFFHGSTLSGIVLLVGCGWLIARAFFAHLSLVILPALRGLPVAGR